MLQIWPRLPYSQKLFLQDNKKKENPSIPFNEKKIYLPLKNE